MCVMVTNYDHMAAEIRAAIESEPRTRSLGFIDEGLL
jgi:hypothetical protein